MKKWEDEKTRHTNTLHPPTQTHLPVGWLAAHLLRRPDESISTDQTP